MKARTLESALAKRRNNIEIKKLLESGADLNTIATNGKTILYHPHFVNYAVTSPQFNLDINHTDNNGRTALYNNLCHNSFWTLVNYGANIYIQDNEGNNLLHYLFGHDKIICSEYNHKSRSTTAKILVELGIDPNMQDDNGNTIAHLAVNLLHQDSDRYLRSELKKQNFLLNRKLTPVDLKKLKKKPHSYNRLRIIKELGCDFSIRNNDGDTVFDLLDSFNFKRSRKQKILDILNA